MLVSYLLVYIAGTRLLIKIFLDRGILSLRFLAQHE